MGQTGLTAKQQEDVFIACVGLGGPIIGHLFHRAVCKALGADVDETMVRFHHDKWQKHAEKAKKPK